MRDIIFRGKTTSGRWIEGYLTKKMVFRNKSNDGVLVDAIVTAVYYNEDREVVEEWHEVDKNTIGQYTGLKDCNGTEIYEGDILESKYGSKSDVFYWGGCFYCGSISLAERVSDGHRVIGNKFDNPELLKDGN